LGLSSPGDHRDRAHPEKRYRKALREAERESEPELALEDGRGDMADASGRDAHDQGEKQPRTHPVQRPSDEGGGGRNDSRGEQRPPKRDKAAWTAVHLTREPDRRQEGADLDESYKKGEDAELCGWKSSRQQQVAQDVCNAAETVNRCGPKS
jgi:hypothetical protein